MRLTTSGRGATSTSCCRSSTTCSEPTGGSLEKSGIQQNRRRRPRIPLRPFGDRPVLRRRGLRRRARDLPRGESVFGDRTVMCAVIPRLGVLLYGLFCFAIL